MMTGDQATGRQCILDQARQQFSAHGYHGVSIRDIVQACGLSNAALYHHFESKENLFLEVSREYIATFVQTLQEAAAGTGSCGERLANVAEAYAQFILDSRINMQTLLRDLVECDSEELQHLVSEAEGKIPATFATVLDEGIASGEIRAVDAHRVSHLVLGMLNSMAARRMFGLVAETLEEDIDLAIGTLLEGISA